MTEHITPTSDGEHTLPVELDKIASGQTQRVSTVTGIAEVTHGEQYAVTMDGARIGTIGSVLVDAEINSQLFQVVQWEATESRSPYVSVHNIVSRDEAIRQLMNLHWRF